MVAVIIGQGGALDALVKGVPENRCRVPVGGGPREEIRYITEHPAPKGRGIVFTNVPGNWLAASRAGWRVLWCDSSQVPVGATELPEATLEKSITDLTYHFWGVRVPDRRLLGDLLLGHTNKSGVVLAVTSATGGVGKTVTSRRLCERAAEMGVSSLLVDGNMLQSSQRSFFDPSRTKPCKTIANWRPGMDPRHGANPGKRLGIDYDVCFAPPVGTKIPWSQYSDYLTAARKLWGLIVLDLDRISAADLTNPNTAAGGLLVPLILSGDPCLFIVKAERQTQGDAMSVLSRMPALELPKECIGIKDTIPASYGDGDYQPIDYSPYGMFMGAERQSEEANLHIADGESNWDDDGLDLVRERVLEWAMPDVGFDPEEFEPQRGGLFGGGKKKRRNRDKDRGRTHDRERSRATSRNRDNTHDRNRGRSRDMPRDRSRGNNPRQDRGHDPRDRRRR